MSQDTTEIIKLIIGAISIIIPICMACATALILWGRRAESIKTIQESFTALSAEMKEFSAELSYVREEQQKIVNEIYPAMKNGGVITQDQLDRQVKALEKSINTSIDAIARQVEQHARINRRDHNLSSDSIDLIVEKVTKEIRKS